MLMRVQRAVHNLDEGIPFLYQIPMTVRDAARSTLRRREFPKREKHEPLATHGLDHYMPHLLLIVAKRDRHSIVA